MEAVPTCVCLLLRSTNTPLSLHVCVQMGRSWLLMACAADQASIGYSIRVYFPLACPYMYYICLLLVCGILKCRIWSSQFYRCCHHRVPLGFSRLLSFFTSPFYTGSVPWQVIYWLVLLSFLNAKGNSQKLIMVWRILGTGTPK